MKGPEVETFSTRLSAELAVLGRIELNELLVRVGRMELKMRASGKERPDWRGPISESEMLGADVVIPTEQGERRGRVICFGVVHAGGEDWEKSVIVHVPASGTQHEGPGSQVRLATAEDSQRILGELEMAQRLAAAADGAQKSPTPITPEKRARRGQRDPKMIEVMLALANASDKVRSVEEGGSNHKITGTDSSRRIYLFKNQLRVDLSGFSIDHPAVRVISDEEARDMHLGKVRGQLLFDDRTMAMEAFASALAVLGS